MKYVFAIALYIGAGAVVANALMDPTPDTLVAAFVAMYAIMAMLNERVAASSLEGAGRALAAVRKQLAEQDIMLRAIRDAIDSNDVEPLRRYWRDSRGPNG